MSWSEPFAPRLRYAALTALTIAVGLGVHLRGTALPATLRDMAGDALWAAMITWGLGVLAPALRLSTRAGLALAVCAAVECSQLLRFPALDAVRQTSVGHLFLGRGFDPRDFLAYAAGVAAAAGLEAVARARGR